MAFKKLILLTCSFGPLIFLGSCMNSVKIADIENSLNMQIGRHYNQLGPGWTIVSEDDKNIVLGRSISKTCSYIVHIPKDTYRIDSWKLTTPRNACDNIPITGA